MSEILDDIISNKKLTKEDVKQKIKAGYSKIPLFSKLATLKYKTLFEHINRYRKLRTWTLEALIEADAINLEEQNESGLTLVQLYITQNNIDQVRMLLVHGVRLKKEDLSSDTEEEMKIFLNYRPGSDESSIIEFCSKRYRSADYLMRVKALVLDAADTTDNESSDAESFSRASLSSAEQKKLGNYRDKKLKEYNKNPEKNPASNHLCLVAARGVHFSPRYFKPKATKKVKAEKNLSHTTYSQSTLFDAGYAADDEVNEKNKKIVARHKKNIKFIKDLKEKEDCKEKKTKSHTPPDSRNKIVFENLYYRFMQVYINSYSTLFNTCTIKSDFNFDSQYNPVISASWNFEKSAMYSSGFRFEWKTRDLRKNPHYRRFTGKAKHPNMGYIDTYMLDVTYVRANGFDRQLMCQKGLLHLSAFYRAEAEIIFFSMLPKQYHEHRYIISLPSFDLPYHKNEGYFARYGIDKKLYEQYKGDIRSLPASIGDKAYASSINTLTEKVVTAQAKSIERTTDYRLFKSVEPKVIVHDHGDSLKKEPFKL
ncbi:MAG: hypothetical protein NXI01_04870 [Gammaproteobacteria bacterium]|nr:hypothetical protein [Gammaproteobacteria bacterium]